MVTYRSSESVTVPVTTLDLLLERIGANSPFLIKIDVQGYELFVFRGAERTLAKECTVVSEFWPWGLESAGYKAKDYLQLMEARGYSACDLKGYPIARNKLDKICEHGKHDRFVVTHLLFQRPPFCASKSD